MILDFESRVLEKIKSYALPYPFKISLGILLSEDNICIASLPGSRTVRGYMDGIQDKEINYEAAIKVNNKQLQAVQTLTSIAEQLEREEAIESHNGSFDFQGITITNAPFLEGQDAKGYFIFRMEFQALLTVYNTKEE